MAFLEQSFHVRFPKSYFKACASTPELHRSTPAAACGQPVYSTPRCTVQCCVQCTVQYSTGSGCSRKLTSSGSQETSFMLRQCSLATICHHMTSAVVDITPSPTACCVFRSLPLCRLGAVLELENILEEELEPELVAV